MIGMDSKWISVEDGLPEHEDTVLCYTPKGFCVCLFVDTVKMMKQLRDTGLAEDPPNPHKPYAFASQEVKGNVINNCTHWQPLPEMPCD